MEEPFDLGADLGRLQAADAGAKTRPQVDDAARVVPLLAAHGEDEVFGEAERDELVGGERALEQLVAGRRCPPA